MPLLWSSVNFECQSSQSFSLEFRHLSHAGRFKLEDCKTANRHEVRESYLRSPLGRELQYLSRLGTFLFANCVSFGVWRSVASRRSLGRHLIFEADRLALNVRSRTSTFNFTDYHALDLVLYVELDDCFACLPNTLGGEPETLRYSGLNIEQSILEWDVAQFLEFNRLRPQQKLRYTTVEGGEFLREKILKFVHNTM